MKTEDIQDALQTRFLAALPDDARRRLIFWQDADREFEEVFDEMVLPPGTEKIKLSGCNNFAVKKRLLHDEPDRNFLIYVPFREDRPQDDWLLDVVLYSEVYRADRVSMLMQELKMKDDPSLREAVKMYGAFFRNRDRTEKLSRLMPDCRNVRLLHLAVMAVLTGADEPSPQSVLRAVLESDDPSADAIPEPIRKFGSVDAFGVMVHRYTGLMPEGHTLADLATHVVLNAMAHQVHPEALRGLEEHLSGADAASFCYSLVHEWRLLGDRDLLWAWCREAEALFRLPSRFDKTETSVLLKTDIFPAVHESLLKRFLADAASGAVLPDRIREALESMRSAGWSYRFRDYEDCLRSLADLEEAYKSLASSVYPSSPVEIWQWYTKQAYLADSHYRHFHEAYARALRAECDDPAEALKKAADYVEGVYANGFLKSLNDCWLSAVSAPLASAGFVPEVTRQRDFYGYRVGSLLQQKVRAFVIISDALRYETAAELRDELSKESGEVTLDSALAEFPSVTKFGMAALLPGKSLEVNEKLEVLRDGLPTLSTPDRERVLCAAHPESVAMSYEEVLNMKQEERRQRISGKDVVYIYHNSIDATGDKSATEKSVFEACKRAIAELKTLVRTIVNSMKGSHILITADHGFLYTFSPLSEGNKVGRDVIAGNLLELGRRYALASAGASAEFLLPVCLQQQLDGVPLCGFAPQDVTRIKKAGGGENYVHGGISLQEMVIPVLSFKKISKNSKRYVEALPVSLKLLSECHKVCNLIFSLDFLQEQPVGDKCTACKYSVYMTDAQGKVISDRKSILADRTSLDASERTFRVSMSLIPDNYDNRQRYKLVIENGTDTPESIEFQIDNAFSGDFGFDL